MGITPAGNRRQMKYQTYLDNDFASNKLKESLEKLSATMDFNQNSFNNGAFEQSQPQTPSPIPDDSSPNNFGQDVKDVMNQSNTLPGNIDENAGKTGLEADVGKIVGGILKGLQLNPEEWKVQPVSIGEKLQSLTITRIPLKAGPEVQKP